MDYVSLTPEAALESKDALKPAQDWPISGQITARDVSLKYSEDGDKVLNEINFNILPKEKVNINNLIPMLFYYY